MFALRMLQIAVSIFARAYIRIAPTESPKDSPSVLSPFRNSGTKQQLAGADSPRPERAVCTRTYAGTCEIHVSDD